MTTLQLSSTSTGLYSRCPTAYRMAKVLGRRPVRASSGLIAGVAMHDAIEVLQKGGDAAAQEKAIDAVLAETPIMPSEKEYRTAAFLKDGLAAFRAEHASTFAGWVIEEIECHSVVDLGYTTYRLSSGEMSEALVRWEFRRDMVGVNPSGQRLCIDWKTAARNEEAQIKAMQNSGQFMGYVAAWQIQYPDKPMLGVQPVRIILRKPTKNGVCFELPRDGTIYFPESRISEWKRHTLRKAREILERDPTDPDSWPMACAELGCCRHTFGVCEFLSVCVLPPEDRALKLATDEFEDTPTHENNPADPE